MCSFAAYLLKSVPPLHKRIKLRQKKSPYSLIMEHGDMLDQLNPAEVYFLPIYFMIFLDAVGWLMFRYSATPVVVPHFS